MIFDLGGVIVELGPVSDIVGDEIGTDPDFWQRWLASEAVREFEGGMCNETQFGERFVSEFDLEFSPQEFVDRFRSWPRGLFADAEELLEDLGRHPDIVVGALSNSNPVHWHEQQDATRIRSLFDRPFLSYELQLVKPDRAIFEVVSNSLALRPEEILYFDDNHPNVDSARAAGWRAELARGPMDCRVHLAALGLVSYEPGP